MSIWSRMANVFRGDRLSREIDEELRSHFEEAVEQGRDAAELQRAMGPTLRWREQSRDFRLVTWMDALRADAVFGWRQIRKKKAAAAAAVLSLGLAIGACTSAFRLIDALLLRPLPVAQPERLYSLFHESPGADGRIRVLDTYEYALFRRMRAAVKDQAELVAASTAYPMDVTYQSDSEMERALVQYVSGWMFESFGLRPAVGRLLHESDDLQPGAHPYAVITYDYWKRRFGRDPEVVGRTFHLGSTIFTIVGVAEERFTGTQTGTVTDVFIPTMMNEAVTQPTSGWIRVVVRLKPGAVPDVVRERLRVPFRVFREEQGRQIRGMNTALIQRYLSETLMMEPAASGVSMMQREFRRPLIALGLLAGVVLLIACGNVANLMTAQAAARAREMALRVSIGAGRRRLVQLVLVESAMLALLATAAGALLAAWSAPWVVSRISRADYPTRLSLAADWRVLGFGLAVALGVTFLFGLAPAAHASAVRPVSALRGGDRPRSRQRLMRALIGVQVAFCSLVLLTAGLFAATSERLTNRPTGFVAQGLLLLDAAAERAQPQAFWDEVTARLGAFPGVEAAALSAWPVLDGNVSVWSISINGGPPDRERAYFMNVSPGWIGAMKIPFRSGRDFRASDTYPGATIVNEAFVKQYFAGENPLGKYFERTEDRVRLEIVGVVGDSRYHDLREPARPVAYVPFQSLDTKGAVRARRTGTFIVRAAGANPMALASILRREVARVRPEFRIRNIRTQEELVRLDTVRERLLATLALFFAAVALLLAGIGLFGVLDYSVVQRRHEIGIRMAIGARPGDIARRVTADMLAMVAAGAVAGVGIGLVSVRYIEVLLYEVKPTDTAILAVPAAVILLTAAAASLPSVWRAVRIDPAATLRSE